MNEWSKLPPSTKKSKRERGVNEWWVRWREKEKRDDHLHTFQTTRTAPVSFTRRPLGHGQHIPLAYLPLKVAISLSLLEHCVITYQCSFYIPRRPFSQEKERQRVEMAAAAAALPSFFFSSSSSVLISNWSVVVGYLMIMAQKKKDSLLLPLLLNRSLPDRLVCRWWAMRTNSGLKLPITRLNRGISLCMPGTMGSFQGRLQQQQ